MLNEKVEVGSVFMSIFVCGETRGRFVLTLGHFQSLVLKISLVLSGKMFV